MAYLHSIGVVHRDIKPSNLLTTHGYNLVIGDFGSAKLTTDLDSEDNATYICSRFYRAPELIFGNKEYGSPIDIWSAGCCFAELLKHAPLFKGSSTKKQIVEIIKVLGTPTSKQISEMAPEYKNKDFPIYKAPPIESHFLLDTDDQAIQLLQKIL